MNIVVIDLSWIEVKPCLTNLDWKIFCDKNLVYNVVHFPFQYLKGYVIYDIQKDGRSILQMTEKPILKVETFLGSLLLLTFKCVCNVRKIIITIMFMKG